MRNKKQCEAITHKTLFYKGGHIYGTDSVTWYKR